jgi:hypothetical protein
MKPLTIKEQAISYRKQGYSYTMIKEKLDVAVAKSTLSIWLKDTPFAPNEKVIARIQFAKRKLILAAQERGLATQRFREEIQQKAKKEITKIDRENLWYIGVALYLAEGGKKQKQIQVTNSDPRVIKIIMKWLMIICGVNIGDVAAAVHIYPDTNEDEAIKFWSKITNIPKSQFQKTIIDRRIKKLKIKRGFLPYGTLTIRVRKGGILFAKISGWIEGILEKSA